MWETYENCPNLITAVCGPNVTNMAEAFCNCINLTTAVCGPNVTRMYATYSKCTNLTTPVCGPNVTDMVYAYKNCSNLTVAVCGPNVIDMSGAFSNCINIRDAYLYSKSVTNVTVRSYTDSGYKWFGVFYGKNNSSRLNIYVPENSTTLTTCLNSSYNYSLIGSASITWTNDLTKNGYYYNTAYNIYIYPVSNVAEVRAANGD
jgi:hypothetical protein